MHMDIKINRESVIPIYTQIYNTIRAMILSGAMPAGYKLPPERKLAEQLGVNRSTVLNAYRDLKAIGLIESHIGQGTTVADFRYGEPVASVGATKAGGIYDTTTDGRAIKAGGVYDTMADVGASMAGGRYDTMADVGAPMAGGRYDTMADGGASMADTMASRRGSMTSARGPETGDVQGKMTGRGPMTDGEYGRMHDRMHDRRVSTDDVSERISRGTGHISAPDNSSNNSPMPPMPWDQLFSESSLRMQDTTVRDLLKLSGRKDMILFATGVTVPGIDSLEALRRIQTDVVKSHGHTAVQHMPADGFYPLRESITKLMSDRGINATAAETMVLSGSQQGLDLVTRAFIDPGDIVFVEEPTFFSAFHIFRAAGARVVGVPTDHDGMRTDVLSMLLKRFKPKLIYTIPDFQNPSGAVMSIERRNELLSMAYRNQIIILEDDPYGRLRYEGNAMPALKAMDVHDNVLYLSTFSKLMFPGFRVGWISGPPQVLHRLTILKQMADLHTSSLPQLIFDRFLREGLMKGHLEKAIEENRRRRDIMLEELTAAELEGLSWNKPEGGLYLWCSIPDSMPQSRLLSRAVDNGVSFVPGKTFYPGNAAGNYIRLNFTYPAPEQIKEGVRRLARAYIDVLREHKNDAAEMETALGPIL